MTKKQILFDARWILVENRYDGVSRYSTELARALAVRSDIEVAWLVYDRRQLQNCQPATTLWPTIHNRG